MNTMQSKSLDHTNNYILHNCLMNLRLIDLITLPSYYTVVKNAVKYYCLYLDHS